jgi:hypothetical protein
MSRTDAFADAVGRAGELGFTDVVAHWPRPSSWSAGDEKALETVAGRLPRLRVFGGPGMRRLPALVAPAAETQITPVSAGGPRGTRR